jgi:4-hydroxy 2-oxovalerate aldolase
MEKKIEWLDCTLRDGSYITHSMFGDAQIKGLINKLQDAKCDLIECGWLKNDPHKPGSAYYHVPSDLEPYLEHRSKDFTYLVMIDWDRYDLNNLPVCDGKSLDAIRVVFPHGKHHEGIAVGQEIAKKGYKVYFQAANTLAYSDDDLRDLAKTINEAHPVALSIVDTFGAMYFEDLERIVKVLDKELDPNIRIGFHSHNNQQLSYALTIHFMDLMKKSKHGIMVDSSISGMGRGAGNATSELLVSYLNRKEGGHYNLNAVLQAIDAYMNDYHEQYEWGYSTPYFLAGYNCVHVNNVAYLLEKHKCNMADMEKVFVSMDPDDRKKYNYDLLEAKYQAEQNTKKD